MSLSPPSVIHGQIEPIQLGAPVENEFLGNPVFEMCENVIHEAHPGSKCVPWVIQGFTDARAYAEVGIPTFGFSPLWCPPSLPFSDLGKLHVASARTFLWLHLAAQTLVLSHLAVAIGLVVVSLLRAWADDMVVLFPHAPFPVPGLPKASTATTNTSRVMDSGGFAWPLFGTWADWRRARLLFTEELVHGGYRRGRWRWHP